MVRLASRRAQESRIMHELAICEQILQVALNAAENAGNVKIVKVRVRAGEMRHIVPDLMSHYFEFLTKDTPATGARLEISTIPARAKCKSCSEEYDVEDFDFKCPACGKSEPELLSGMELFLEDIEVEDLNGA